MPDYKGAEEQLIAAACLVAPNENVHQGIHMFYQELRNANLGHEYNVKAIIGVITDGLRFGNWVLPEHFKAWESAEESNEGLASIRHLG